MPALVGTLSFVAGLAALALALLFLGPILPAPYRDTDGGDTLGFAFMVYLLALVALPFGAIGWPQVREAFRSRYTVLAGVSLATVTGYVLFVSYVLFSLTQATDS